MKRRQLLSALATAGALGAVPGRRRASPSPLHDCGCAPQLVTAKDKPPGAAAFRDVGSKLRITNMRVFGVTLDERIAQADRPYVFVKIETNEGVTGWGEATLEGKAAAAMACVMDLKDLIIGSDPMQVEHLYQLMYIGSFYRGGPVLGRRSQESIRRCGTYAAKSWECRCMRCLAARWMRAAYAGTTTRMRGRSLRPGSFAIKRRRRA